MKLILEENLINKFSPVIGVISAIGINNYDGTEEIGAILKDQEEKTRNMYRAEGSVGNNPNISAWRKVYKTMGAESYRCSAEALLRRVLKGDSIPSINKIVDIYNYISLKYSLPVGGEDLDKIEGNITLALAKGDEEFIRIEGSENEPPKENEVVYKDERGVVCRRWNWREADRTKLTYQTKNAILVVDGLKELDREEIEKATHELASLIAKHCKGEVKMDILDRNKREISLL